MLLALVAGAALAQSANAPITVRVLVLSYDPVLEAQGGTTLNRFLGWNDPRRLAEEYIADVRKASGGYVNLKIVEWRDIDEWPKKVDGFRYTDESFVAMWRGDRKTAHQPDEADYAYTLESQKVIPMVERGAVDEVWAVAGPYLGYWEAAMAGPGAFFINGGVYDKVPSKRRFAVMGFSPERGVAEMLHNTSHRAENHFKRAYGGWEPVKDLEKANLWERFSAFEKTSPGFAGVGNCHFPPNAEKDYDYDNPRTVMSDADAWLTYPRLGAGRRPVNRETWGGPDYHRNYLRWWFARIPKAPGMASDGRPNNWWRHIYRFNELDDSGRPRG